MIALRPPEAVFLDSVGLLALWNRNDQWHAAANSAFAVVMASRFRLLTTSYVLLECGNAAARRPFRKQVLEFRNLLLSRGGLIEPTNEDCESAWEAYNRGEAAQAGIVDHISFVVMRRLGPQKVFRNDEHFRAAGFELLF